MDVQHRTTEVRVMSPWLMVLAEIRDVPVDSLKASLVMNIVSDLNSFLCLKKKKQVMGSTTTPV